MALRTTRSKAAVLVSTVGLFGVMGAGGAIAVGNDDADETQITGKALKRASAAALAETGGGKVTATEVENDRESAYEVEVTLHNGKQVDVELAKDYKVLAADMDDEVD
jgi:uncharacterized membrane protein YkoI